MNKLYKFNDTYIDLGDIQFIEQSASEDPAYPFALHIYFKSSKEIRGVKYQTRDSCDREAGRIVDAVNCYFRDQNELTQWDLDRIENRVRYVVEREIAKVRRDIKALRRETAE